MSTLSEDYLRQLREGDRVQYHGVQWQIDDYSTYTDDHGYETEEWLLKSQTGKQYYLMREIDPQNPQGQVHWYVAEELRNPTVYDPSSSRDVTLHLGEDMRSHQSPYPEIQMFNRTYQFESQTEGEYETDGRTRTRITWDYWDPSHLWNLALEAWSDGNLSVYSTRAVQPADFAEPQPGTGGFSLGNSSVASGFSQGRSFNSPSSQGSQTIFAIILLVIGFFLMISGI